MDSILQVNNLTKQYDGFKLDHVSFSVPKGAIMGLIGENGAGKSTTINAILDLIHKDEGTVTFWGQELSGSKQLKEDIGVVFDGINFYETLTPAKVGKIGRTAYKQWDAHLYQEYLKRFQLPLDKEIKTLSKGMNIVSSHPCNTLVFPGLELRLKERTVHRNGELISMTHREFATLVYLANHPSWVFSAGQIYEEVWGEDGENCGTAVASVIGQIRRKLTPDMPKAGYIRTVLGSGYKFEVPQGMAE